MIMAAGAVHMLQSQLQIDARALWSHACLMMILHQAYLITQRQHGWPMAWLSIPWHQQHSWACSSNVHQPASRCREQALMCAVAHRVSAALTWPCTGSMWPVPGHWAPLFPKCEALGACRIVCQPAVTCSVSGTQPTDMQPQQSLQVRSIQRRRFRPVQTLQASPVDFSQRRCCPGGFAVRVCYFWDKNSHTN